MFGFLATIIVGGGFVYLVSSGKSSTEQPERDEVPVPTPEPLGDAFPQPDPVTEPDELVNVVEASTLEEYSEARDVVEGRRGEPRTLYLGTSPDWAGASTTRRRILELAEDRPELRVMFFNFETTRSRFGVPDTYLAFAATSTGPDGEPFQEVFTADRPEASALSTSRLARLVRHADEGTPETTPPRRDPSGFSL